MELALLRPNMAPQSLSNLAADESTSSPDPRRAYSSRMTIVAEFFGGAFMRNFPSGETTGLPNVALQNLSNEARGRLI